MRLKHKDPVSRTLKEIVSEPLAESINQSHPKGFFKTMSSLKLIEYGEEFIRRTGTESRAELRKADLELSNELSRRKLLDAVFKNIDLQKHAGAVDGVLDALDSFDEEESAGESSRSTKIPLRRGWVKMTDDELLSNARAFMDEKGITGRKELQKADNGLYDALHRRSLLDRVGFAVKHRDWEGMGDDEIVGQARRIMGERGITGRKELQKADKGLYSTLLHKSLLDRVGFVVKHRSWEGKTDDEIVGQAKRIMGERGIRTRKGLKLADMGLYHVLLNRELMDSVGFEKIMRTPRSWEGLDDVGFVARVQECMAETGITGRNELMKADPGLYGTLLKRKRKNPGIMEKIGFEKIVREKRGWSGMDDMALIRHAKKLMDERKISGKSELKVYDAGLYGALRKRGLLQEIGFVENLRDWNVLGKDELIAYTEKFMEENAISRANELQKADSGLYAVLGKRKLLDHIGFTEKKRDWNAPTDEELIEYTEKQMKDKGIRRRAELQKEAPGLYGALLRRKLLGKVGFERVNEDWRAMSDSAIVAYAKRLIREKGIRGKTGLQRNASGLYKALGKRKLLDVIFSKTESSKQIEAVEGVLDALDSFGDER